jgi:hypothetical protein
VYTPHEYPYNIKYKDDSYSCSYENSRRRYHHEINAYATNCCAERLPVSDHRGSNSQVVDFERVEIYPVFTAKIENPEKSST